MMMVEKKSVLRVLLSLALAATSCDQLPQPQLKQESDTDLRLTFGGFREGHPDEGELSGVCTPDVTRTSMDCDIYNGIQGWGVREVTLVVTWFTYGQDDKRYYSESVSLDPQKTEHVTIRLGLQLPLDTQLRNRRGLPIGPPSHHWGWNLVGAKGHQIH
jgi:hypothetical protein